MPRPIYLPNLQPAEIDPFLPESVPNGWRHFVPKATANVLDGIRYFKFFDLMVMASAQLEADGKLWMHVSMSRPDRMPTYDDMVRVKETFVGPNREAYQVFPRADEHVNEHKFCLHLWTCLAGRVLPDFRRFGSI